MTDRNPTPFGDRLRALREQAGLSIPQLADRSGIHRSQIYRIETGETPDPTWATA